MRAAALPEAEARESAGLRRSLPFAACFIYAPRGAGLLSIGGRVLCQRVKTSDPLWVPRYAGCVARLYARARLFQRVFARDAVLVPVPGSVAAGTAQWAAWQLAMAFQQLGLAQGVWVGLERQFPVRKSATALPGERPTVWQHYASLTVGPIPKPHPQKVVLVDDVITKGRTLLAAAARLGGELPHADITAFALIRTLGFVNRIKCLLTPCEGFVYWTGRDARREP
jgi:adenine/guanine phosphoribosyltransferase-like PRPP-binding protein